MAKKDITADIGMQVFDYWRMSGKISYKKYLELLGKTVRKK